MISIKSNIVHNNGIVTRELVDNKGDSIILMGNAYQTVVFRGGKFQLYTNGIEDTHDAIVIGLNNGVSTNGGYNV